MRRRSRGITVKRFSHSEVRNARVHTYRRRNMRKREKESECGYQLSYEIERELANVFVIGNSESPRPICTELVSWEVYVCVCVRECMHACMHVWYASVWVVCVSVCKQEHAHNTVTMECHLGVEWSSKGHHEDSHVLPEPEATSTWNVVLAPLVWF